MKRRLFVAADLDDATRSACADVADRLRAQGWTGRWVPPRNYHLTVAFLGGVDDERVEDVVRAGRTAAQSAAAFDVPLDTVGAFPNARKPRVVWVGPAAAMPAFGALCGGVRGALTAHGFAIDERAAPHVTLARSDGRAPLPLVEAPRVAPLRIAALTLYESITAPAGAQHDVIERFPLLG